MNRRRSFRVPQSDDAARALRVDLSRVSQWKDEIEAIRKVFNIFDLQEVTNAARLIYSKLWQANLIDSYGWAKERNEETLDSWIKGIKPDDLIEFSSGYRAPSFLAKPARKDIVSALTDTRQRYSDLITNARKNGITSSSLISMFTARTEERTIQDWIQSEQKYSAALAQTSQIRAAEDLIDAVMSLSQQHIERWRELNKSLALAEKKSNAWARFEAKHGMPLAKAAAADKKTRGRAKALKSLVQKTDACPYCSKPIGPDAQLDHIYPVAKGGLSVVENLAWCCIICNSGKGDKGLIQFLTERDIEIGPVIMRLHQMKKHV